MREMGKNYKIINDKNALIIELESVFVRGSSSVKDVPGRMSQK